MPKDKVCVIIKPQKSRGLKTRMFLGEQYHQKDNNNRIRIPQVFRGELGSDFYFAKGLQGMLYIYTKEYVNEQMQSFDKAANEFEMGDIEAVLEYSSNLRPVSEDKQGRITIPDDFVDFANLKKEIVTVGVGKFLIMMSADLRNQQKNKAREENIKKLSEMRKRKD